MIKKIKTFIMITITSLTLTAPGLVPALASTASANNGTITDSLCKGVGQASGGVQNCGNAGTGDSSNGLQSIAQKVVNIFSIVVGIIAVIMIIYGGFRYITSGGASDSVSNAKNTLIYAIVGLIIVALAQIIVHYVINTVTTSTNGVS